MGARLTDEQTVPVMRAAGLEPRERYPGAGRLRAQTNARSGRCERRERAFVSSMPKLEVTK